MKKKLRFGIVPGLFFAAKVLFEGEQNASPENFLKNFFFPPDILFFFCPIR